MPASSSTPTGSLSRGGNRRAETPPESDIFEGFSSPPSRPRPSRLLSLANTKAAPLCHRSGGGADRFRLIVWGWWGGSDYALIKDRSARS